MLTCIDAVYGPGSGWVWAPSRGREKGGAVARHQWSRRAAVGASLALASSVLAVSVGSSAGAQPTERRGLGGVEHIVVIYEENHSFDNLFGLWPGVNGLGNADFQHTVQIGLDGAPLPCLPQNDVNLTSPVPLPTRCVDPTLVLQSAFT